MTALYLIFFQANIRIDNQGTARIAGFASATLQLEADIALEYADGSDEFNVSRWCSPEILHPSGFGLTKAKATKASDVYAFGMLAYEASFDFWITPQRCSIS